MPAAPRADAARIAMDGGVRSGLRPEPGGRPDAMLGPDAVAGTCLALPRQPRSAWPPEVELRAQVEPF